MWRIQAGPEPPLPPDTRPPLPLNQQAASTQPTPHPPNQQLLEYERCEFLLIGAAEDEGVIQELGEAKQEQVRAAACRLCSMVAATVAAAAATAAAAAAGVDSSGYVVRG